MRVARRALATALELVGLTFYVVGGLGGAVFMGAAAIVRTRTHRS